MRDAADIVSAARRDHDLVVLEGLHPLKHALRFGADLRACVVEDGCDLAAAAADHAPDLLGRLTVPVMPVAPARFESLCRRRPPVPVLSVARRPRVDVASALASPGPAILLEDPVHLGNVGAVVRVAAAATAAAVLTTGSADPWHPAALRGAAGLHFAVPVARVDHLPAVSRTVVAFDPQGIPLSRASVPDDAVLAFGTERAGLSEALRARADQVVSIPMRPGVSSLNLATCVAVAVYAVGPATG